MIWQPQAAWEKVRIFWGESREVSRRIDGVMRNWRCQVGSSAGFSPAFLRCIEIGKIAGEKPALRNTVDEIRRWFPGKQNSQRDTSVGHPRSARRQDAPALN